MIMNDETLKQCLDELKGTQFINAFGVIDYIRQHKEKISELTKEVETLKNNINAALDIAYQYAQIDGDHHKAWCIDQMVRILLGDKYKDWVKEYMFGDSDPVEAVQEEDYYKWDIGIAP